MDRPTQDNDTSFLNLLRGLSALYVVVAHCSIWGGAFDLIDPKIAVDIFMILSGFLMIYTVERRHDRWRNFLLRRYFRLAPAYYLALAMMVALFPFVTKGWDIFIALNPDRWPDPQDYSRASLGNLALHASLLFGLSPVHSSSSGLPDWSIGLEVQFYLLFPLIYTATRGRFGSVSALGLGLAAMVATKAYSIAIAQGLLPAFAEPSLLIFRLQYFIIGMLLFRP